MFDIYNNSKDMVFAFRNDKLCFINEAAQYYFNSYAYTLMDKDISAFIEFESLKTIKENTFNEKFISSVTLTDGKTHNFEIKPFNDFSGNRIVLYECIDKPKATGENLLRSVNPKSLYDPLKIGKTEIYKNELSKIADKAYAEINFLDESVLLKRNPSLSECVVRIKNDITDILNLSRRIIDELSSQDGGKYVLAKSVFNLNEMLGLITKRAENYIKIENLNIELSYTSRNSEVYISAAYYSLLKSVSGLISNAINYVIASGRKGRINIKLTSNENNAIIEITDNGIGLSEETFEGINEEEKDISTLSGQRKKEFLNLQLINSYIRTNNGELTLENIKEKGSKAIIKLPLLSKTYSTLRQNSYRYGIDDEIDKILRNGIIHI